MQFKHPELLYALLLLIIPIIVHLFQLRRFQKVEFTNVKFLKELTLQTRKSSQLKKWLTLLLRLLLLSCIIIAFAQPFISNSETFNSKSETVIYLDNSFSLQAKSNNGTLLNQAIQDLIEHVDENETISFFTNNQSFKNTTLKAIKNDIIKLSFSPNQLAYDAVVLKGKGLFSKDLNAVKNLVLISDFQQKSTPLTITNDSTFNTKLVQLKPISTQNTSIDSVYFSKINTETIELTVLLKNQGEAIETLPVSLYNKENLIAKSSVAIKNSALTTFNLPINEFFDGEISIEDQNLQYDNSLFFNLDIPNKIKVLSINEAKDLFLKKMYTDDEFLYSSTPINTLNYNTIADQNLIILNELNDIPNSLITALKSFTNDGGSLLIIPSNEITLNTYNQLFTNYSISPFKTKIGKEKRVTSIHFSHPLLANVFDKKVTNFQYPKVNTSYLFNSIATTPILSYEDNMPFLIQSNQTFVFSSALNETNSNFKNSPLIVPILYNIGKQSLKTPQIYYTIGLEHHIDISTLLSQDDILSLQNKEQIVIPQQHVYTNKVELITNEYPTNAGIVSVMNKDQFLKNLSFNYQRTESDLNYFNISEITNLETSNSISSVIDTIKSSTNVNELWKWFIIFALAFLVIEMLILKLLK